MWGPIKRKCSYSKQFAKDFCIMFSQSVYLFTAQG